MGRKRKAEKGDATAEEDKTSNACSDAKTVEEKIHDLCVSPSNKTKSIVTNGVLRRSGRLINSASPTWRKQVKPVVEHINLDRVEGEEAPVAQQVNTSPVVNERNKEKDAPPLVQPVSTVSIVNERSLEDKVEYLIHSFGEFMSKTVKQVSKSPNEGPATYFSYKSLYINSQKKIEDLMEENYQLVKKLEFAHGKIEAYEKMKDSMCASKEVILLSNLEKSNKIAVNLEPTVAAAEAANDQKTSPKPKKNKHKVVANATSGNKTRKSNHKKEKAKS